MRPTNDRCRYNVTTSLIGWAHTETDPCLFTYLYGDDSRQWLFGVGPTLNGQTQGGLGLVEGDQLQGPRRQAAQTL